MRYHRFVDAAASYQRVVSLLEANSRVRLVYAFGSAARGEPAARDLDVAVLLDRRPSWDEERELRAAVVAVEPSADLVVINDAPPVLLCEIVSGGRCLFARTARERAELEIVSLSRHLDYQPVRRVQREYLRARVGERRGAPH